jgi:hypothetical protein
VIDALILTSIQLDSVEVSEVYEAAKSSTSNLIKHSSSEYQLNDEIFSLEKLAEKIDIDVDDEVSDLNDEVTELFDLEEDDSDDAEVNLTDYEPIEAFNISSLFEGLLER